MTQYDIKIPIEAATREIFFDRNSGKLSYKNDNGIVAPLESSSAGTLIGPVSSTNNAIPRFNGITGGILKNSGVTIDDNNNITTNNLFDGFTSVAASGTLITLTVSSTPSYLVTGSGGQTIQLPDATTLPRGAVYNFNNNQSSGAILVNNNSTTLVKSVPSGGNMILELLDNSIAAGSWDAHFQAPSNVSWSTNTFDYTGSITGATWNGVSIADNRIASSATWNAKQAALVSGTNIKTVNGTTLLGSGDLAISAGSPGGFHVLIKPISGAYYSQMSIISVSALGVGTRNNGALQLTPFYPANTLTCDSIQFEVTTAVASSLSKVVIYSDLNGTPKNLLYQSGDLDCSTLGYKTITTSFTFTAGTVYYIGVVSNASVGVRVIQPSNFMPISWSTQTQVVITGWWISVAYGSIPSTVTVSASSGNQDNSAATHIQFRQV